MFSFLAWETEGRGPYSVGQHGFRVTVMAKEGHMRTIPIAAYWILLLSCTCSLAWSQGIPLSADAFFEGGGSFISNTEYKYLTCQQNGTTLGSHPCPPPERFTYAGRLFTGSRFHFGHNGFEASYSYSNNPAGLYNRQGLFSFNYVRYLPLKPKVQPFVTVGLGGSRFSLSSGVPSPSYPFKFVWNYGGGGDIALRWRLALRLELRDYVGGQPATFTGLSHNIVPSAGIVFRFNQAMRYPNPKY
jgi:opacity protein-like surface antigen